jgi:phage terminase large subunit
MKKLIAPNLNINFAPSERQYELWKALQPNRCDKCGGKLEMRPSGHDRTGRVIYEPTCVDCGNTDIPERILGGGAAGGGKSYLGCSWVLFSCINFPEMLFAIGRRELKKLKESTWLTLLRVMKQWGLKEDVNYHINNQAGTVTFWNGSVIMQLALAPSLADPEYSFLGSLELSGAFIDEVSEVPEKAIDILASRIRYRVAETFIVGKLFMSTNPSTNWVRSIFVQDDDGTPVVLAKGDRFVRFSLFDNPDEGFRRTYFNKLNKIKDKHTRDRLIYGDWDSPTQNDMAAYWNFDGEKHLVYALKEKYYDPMKPLILSFDFNVSPYMTCLPSQINFEKKEIYIFPEYIGRPSDPNKKGASLNNTPAFSRYIRDELQKDRQLGGVIVTGDPAGKARSTQTEEGINNFTIADDTFVGAGLRPELKLFNKQPAQKTRLEFINEMLNGYGGWKIMVDVRCRRLTDDFIHQRKNMDGTKEKKKVMDDNRDKIEKYGHASDAFDYIITYFCKSDYDKFKEGTDGLIITTVSDFEDVYNDFGY